MRLWSVAVSESLLSCLLARGKSRAVTEVTVFDMKELQKDVAEALYWLRTLIMTVTALHSSKFLTVRPFSGAGALRTNLLIAKMKERLRNGRMIMIVLGLFTEQSS